MTTATPTVSRPRPNAARLAVWWLLAAAWTVALLTPLPARVGREVVPSAAQFSASKGLHVVAYLALAVTVPWTGLRAGKWWLLAFLVLHGVLTEYIQQWVPERTASVRDVLLDWAGVALGVLCTIRYWRRVTH